MIFFPFVCFFFITQGYRDTQRAIVEMSEKAAEIDQMKGATLEDISNKVEQISREFRSKQTQLQPLIGDLKNVRQEYLDVESQYQEKKMGYEKLAVSLDLEKQVLEKECNQFQVINSLLFAFVGFFD
jgi:septal ring factor EnvC (AmiA/AmiB activator)